MSNVEIKDLFDNDRCPGGLSVLLLILYSPIGCMLAVLRIFIGFHTFIISCLLPKMSSFRSMVLRTMCGVLGIIVSTDGIEQRNSKAKVLVANYTSTLDHLAVDLVMPTIIPSVWDLPPTLMWMLGYQDMGASKGRDVLIRNAKKHIAESPTPLLVFPEGASTNGKKGLLKFSIWPFSLEKPVQPIVIKITRPSFTQVSPSVLGGRWWIDLFWFLFVPYSVFNIKFLPSVEEGDDETVEEFTERTQKLVANGLGVDATKHTSSDKVEYTKQKLFIRNDQGAAGVASSGDNPQDMMVYQVREVLPEVPVQVIKNDLAMTKDVDLTITNILEGRVQYTPEVAGVEATAGSPDNNTTHMPPRPALSTSTAAASSFGRTSHARAMSFEDRKEDLLDYARRKYKEKHGLE